MSERPYILHMFTPQTNVSPFDVNMAVDAGFQHLIPYMGLTLDDIGPYTQDAIFSRGPKGVRRTAIFVGGRDAIMATDMLDRARKSMVPPFEVSVFADPSGAYTTAAAMIAAVERQLAKAGASLDGANVSLLGPGPVGAIAAVMAARSGARVTIGSSSGKARAEQVAKQFNDRFGVNLIAGDASSDAARLGMVKDADVLLAAAKAGVQVADAATLAGTSRLKVAADINAVPPSGIAGVGVMDDGAQLACGAVGVGALAIGNIKYHTQQSLLRRMIESDKPVYLGIDDALAFARAYVKG